MKRTGVSMTKMTSFQKHPNQRKNRIKRMAVEAIGDFNHLGLWVVGGRAHAGTSSTKCLGLYQKIAVAKRLHDFLGVVPKTTNVKKSVASAEHLFCVPVRRAVPPVPPASARDLPAIA